MFILPRLRCPVDGALLLPMERMPGTYLCPVCGVAQVISSGRVPAFGGSSLVLKGGDTANGKKT